MLATPGSEHQFGTELAAGQQAPEPAREITPAQAAVAGADPAADGFVWSAGLGGTGIQTAPAIGLLTARAAAAALGTKGPDLAHLGPSVTELDRLALSSAPGRSPRLGYAALAAFVALDMASRGVANGIIALNAYGAAYVGVRLVIGNLPDRLGPHRIAVWSALVEAVGLVMVAMATNLAVAVIGGLVMGTGLSLLFPSPALLVINRTEASQQGAALGAFTSFWDIGVAVGGPLAGLVATISYPAIFWVMAGCAVLSAGLSASGMRCPKPVPAPSGATMRT
jgi:MFS family permease